MRLLQLYKYTDKEIDQICKSIVVLVDTREQKNEHITKWFDKRKIAYKSKALTNGDYSFYIPADDALNINRDLYFDKQIAIERKHNLAEISGNFTQSRSRFEEEFSTFPGKLYLLIEKANYSDIVDQNYKTKLSTKAFLGSLHTFNHRYGAEVVFMPDNNYSGMWIYLTFVYYIKTLLH